MIRNTFEIGFCIWKYAMKNGRIPWVVSLKFKGNPERSGVSILQDLPKREG